MTTHPAPAFSPAIQLDHSLPVPLYQQIYRWLRSAILNGQFKPGTRLPSTRLLADELAVSRNTVLTAFEQLMAEGYVEGKTGGGSYVSHLLPEEAMHPQRSERWAASLPLAAAAARPNPAASIRSLPVLSSLAFRPNLPALDVFPIELWGRLVSRRWRHRPRELLGYAEAAGYRPLREAVAAYLQVSRAVRCEPDQVIIVNGSQHALDLAARVLLQPGDAVWIEDPGYPGARRALAGHQANLVPVPIDQEGFNLAMAQRRNTNAKLVYVTPSCQYPLGVTMSLARRLSLLDWANQNDGWILEDDYSSEYRYAGRPLSALQGLAAKARVIYAGTFSKVLFPALRLGYLVVPPNLIRAFVETRFRTDIHSPTMDQAVLADFMTEGHFVRHLRRMRKLYRERQAILVAAAREQLAGLLEIQPVDGGLHLMGWLPRGVDDVEAWQRALDHGVVTQPLSACCLEPFERGGLLLGFAGVDAAKIHKGVQQLAAALKPPVRPRQAQR